MENNKIILKDRVIFFLRATGRPGIESLIEYMETNGFFAAPCSGSHHLAKEGGLAEHSFNVLNTMMDMRDALIDSEGFSDDEMDKFNDSIILCAILHDLGKIGQYGKPNYVPNMLKGRATKANPNPEPKQSEAKPFKTNPDLMYVDHEVRSVVIAQQFIPLTEEEQQAILWHNGLYGTFKYEIQGKEFPLYLLLHFADMWASRVIEKTENNEEE